MKRLFKSKKALSPVVASIILIAVTVAVSIAVASWMGALTFTFTKTEELKITSMTFGTGTIVLSVKNSGTSKVTVSSAKLNDAAATIATGSDLEYDAGDTGTITLTASWTSGNKYKVELLSATGTTVAAYETTA
jgi:flagellin-like protein